jgi:tetratricopeptide (TPR) repeat protein
VEGQLRRAGATLDVEVFLVSGDGRRRPAGRYAGSIGRPLDLQRRVVEGVVAALAATGAVSSPVSARAAPPTSNQEAFAEYAQAQAFLERPDVPQHLDHAIRLFQSAIFKDPKFALAHAGLGRAYWAQYHETEEPQWTSKATAAILDALLIDPNLPEVRMSLAVMYQGLGRLDAAEEELGRVIAAQPGNDDAYRLLAGVNIDRGQWNAAVAGLEKAIKLRPNYWRNHSELGYVHYRAGRLEESLKAYHRVVELQPDSARGFHMLGTVYQSAGQSPEAIANYTKANAIRPSPSTYSNIGTIHYWAGEYQKAAEAYQHAIELDPNQPDVHANLGDVLQKLGRRDRARGSYATAVREMRKQLSVNENDPLDLSALGIYLAKLGEREEAKRAVEKALALSPQDAEVLYASAIVDALAGRTVDGCGRLGEALTRGISAEVARQSDELRVLRGCPAYDRISAK